MKYSGDVAMTSTAVIVYHCPKEGIDRNEMPSNKRGLLLKMPMGMATTTTAVRSLFA